MDYDYKEIYKTAREFRDLSSDLLRSTYDEFDTNISHFKSFCDSNQIIQDILAPIKKRNFDVEEWYNNAVKLRGLMGSGSAKLPDNKLDTLKCVYELLWSEKPKGLLINFGHATMFERNFTNQLRRVNNFLTNKLVRYVIRKLEDMLDLNKPQSQHITQTWYINAPSNIATNSYGFSQEINTELSQFKDILNEIREKINDIDLSSSDKDIAYDNLDLIEEETNKSPINKARITRVLDQLPKVNSLINLIEKAKIFILENL
jgi:hypothetical protein